MADTKKILVVDDDVDLCTLLSRFLAKMVLKWSRHTAESRYALLNAGRFDLVLPIFDWEIWKEQKY